jgi:AraC family transcriptional regulator
MMQATAVIAIENHRQTLGVRDVSSETSSEVSQLLQRALRCFEQNEAIAIDLVKRASMLLGPVHVVSDNGILQDKSISGGLAPWQMTRIKRYVADRVSRNLSIDELAESVKLSTSYFSVAFKASFGLSPHNYIVSQRIDRAKHLMLVTDTPLSQIALDCGLADQAHLSRVFRRLTGTTPSAWRRFRISPEFQSGSVPAETGRNVGRQSAPAQR